jgi:hypothetical protein
MYACNLQLPSRVDQGGRAAGRAESVTWRSSFPEMCDISKSPWVAARQSKPLARKVVQLDFRLSFVLCTRTQQIPLQLHHHLSVFLFISLSLTFCHPLSLSVSVSVSFLLILHLSLSLHISLTHILSPSITVCLCLCQFPSHSVCLSLSVCLSVSLSRASVSSFRNCAPTKVM